MSCILIRSTYDKNLEMIQALVQVTKNNNKQMNKKTYESMSN
jgi:hypothetical protein